MTPEAEQTARSFKYFAHLLRLATPDSTKRRRPGLNAQLDDLRDRFNLIATEKLAEIAGGNREELFNLAYTYDNSASNTILNVVRYTLNEGRQNLIERGNSLEPAVVLSEAVSLLKGAEGPTTLARVAAITQKNRPDTANPERYAEHLKKSYEDHIGIVQAAFGIETLAHNAAFEKIGRSLLPKQISR